MRINLEFYNHYSAPIPFEQNALLGPLKRAIQHLECERLILPDAPLHDLTVIELNLVDDTTIANVHQEFMDDPTTTDVITFHHGEVFISYDTAVKEAQVRQISPSEELYRYHLHGILHLAGYDDLSEPDYTRMHTLQEQLVTQYFIEDRSLK